jgi:hypothetical protein
LFQNAGYTVWWDKEMYAGQDINDKLLKEVALAAAVIVLWSPYSVESKWVRGEARLAAEFAKLMPIAISPCNIPIEFTGYNTVELFGKDAESQIQNLFKFIAVKVKYYPADAGDDIWNP